MQLTKRMAPRIYIASHETLIPCIRPPASCFTCHATDHLSQHCPHKRPILTIRCSPTRPTGAQLVQFGDLERGASQPEASPAKVAAMTQLERHVYPDLQPHRSTYTAPTFNGCPLRVERTYRGSTDSTVNVHSHLHNAEGVRAARHH